MKFKFLLILFVLLFGQTAKATLRLISLAPNLTEIVFALGGGQSLVGNTTFCDYPEGAKKVEKIGDFSNFQVEKVIRLKPDYVLATQGNSKIQLEILEKIGLKIMKFTTNNFSQIESTIIDIGKLMVQEKAALVLVQKIKKARFQLETQKPGLSKKALVVLQWSPFIVAGSSTFMGQIFATAKYEVFPDGDNYPTVSQDFLRRHKPDIIFIPASLSQPNQSEILSKASTEMTKIWGSQTPKSVLVDENWFSRPGPRILEAMEFLSKI